jgi:hypothetical protein
MTLLRRAPREVYRVYAEDEFFASQAADETFAESSPGADRRLLRLAGGAMLLAAVGAVAGLVAITSLSSAPRVGRRRGSGLLAAAGLRGSSPLAGARVWQQPAAAPGSPSRGHSIRNATPAPAARRASIPPRALAARGSNAAAAQHSAAVAMAVAPPRPVESGAVEVANRPVSTPVAAPAPTLGASPRGPAPEQAEFGFEHRGPQ